MAHPLLKKLFVLSLINWLIPCLLYAQKGPGLGNLSYSDSEHYKSIWDYREINHWGSNIATMQNGYMVTTFTPDSGKPPGGILVWDVSDPRKPKLIARVYDQRTSTLREAHALPQHGNYILFQDGCGFQIWDFEDPFHPKQIKRFCMSGYYHNDYGAAWQLFWQAPYIFIGNGRGFDIVDAKDINNPVYVKHVNTPLQSGPVFAVGNQLVTTAHDVGKGISVYDISNPRDPKLLNSFYGTENLYSSFTNGNRVVISARGNSNNKIFGVYDISNPASIKKISTLDIGNSAEQLYSSTQDQYIFQGCQSEVVKIDASNPTAMKIVGRGKLIQYGNSDHGQVTPFGNLIFVGNDHGSGSGFWVHQTSPDKKAPEVNMIIPKPNDVNRALTSRIGVTLTDNIIIESVNNKTFIVRPLGGEALTGSYSHQFSAINFSPDQPLKPNTTYEIIIPQGGIKDYAGNPYGATFTSYFSTGPTGDFPPASGGPMTMREENKKIILSWKSISNATKYNVKRGTSPAGPFETIASTDQLTYQDTDVTNDKTYYYTVSGVNLKSEGTPSPVIKAIPSIYITDLKWMSATNGYGPAEKDQCNGEEGANDGPPITMNGSDYSRGLGVHAASKIEYDLEGKYEHFIADIGIDDKVGTSGSVSFVVQLDGTEIYNSSKLTGNSDTKSIDLKVSNGKKLTLIVNTEGDYNSDHSLWAGARLVSSEFPNAVNDEIKEAFISYFPNPITDQITISSTYKIEEVSFQDIHGRTIHTDVKSFTGTRTIDISNILTSGIYFLQIKQENYFRTYKINVK